MSGRITVAAPAGVAEAYLVGEPGRPGVLFFVDAIGLRPRVEAMADRIAGWGYVVLVPHVFYRDGSAVELAPKADLREPGERRRFLAAAMARVRALTVGRSGADAAAWLATLDEHADGGPVGVTGYCMGARLAVRAAGQHPDRVAAVGGWHGGRLATDAPDSPHLAIAASTASYAFGHADRDRSMPPEEVSVLEETLRATGRPYRNEVFAGAEHGYTMADTSSYDEAATERHFAELETLLAGSLLGRSRKVDRDQ